MNLNNLKYIENEIYVELKFKLGENYFSLNKIKKLLNNEKNKLTFNRFNKIEIIVNNKIIGFAIPIIKNINNEKKVFLKIKQLF